jgi:hypothetical protein
MLPVIEAVVEVAVPPVVAKGSWVEALVDA